MKSGRVAWNFSRWLTQQPCAENQPPRSFPETQYSDRTSSHEAECFDWYYPTPPMDMQIAPICQGALRRSSASAERSIRLTPAIRVRGGYSGNTVGQSVFVSITVHFSVWPCARRVASAPLAMPWTFSGSDSIEPIVMRGFNEA